MTHKSKRPAMGRRCGSTGCDGAEHQNNQAPSLGLGFHLCQDFCCGGGSNKGRAVGHTGGGLGSPKAGVPIPRFQAETWKRNRGQAQKSLWWKSVLGEGIIRARDHGGKEPGRDPRERARGRHAGEGVTLYRACKAMREDVFITGTVGSSGEF